MRIGYKKANQNNIGKINNISSYDFYKFYICISRYLSIIWIIFTFSFTLILIVSFFSPNWIGDTNISTNRGYFGLYSFCIRNRLANMYNCTGSWSDYSSLANEASYFKATSFLIGVSCVISLMSVLLIILCVLVKCERVFHLCAWLQCICSKLLLIFF
jgi:hypothetical protein